MNRHNEVCPLVPIVKSHCIDGMFIGYHQLPGLVDRTPSVLPFNAVVVRVIEL